MGKEGRGSKMKLVWRLRNGSVDNRSLKQLTNLFKLREFHLNAQLYINNRIINYNCSRASVSLALIRLNNSGQKQFYLWEKLNKLLTIDDKNH